MILTPAATAGPGLGYEHETVAEPFRQPRFRAVLARDHRGELVDDPHCGPVALTIGESREVLQVAEQDRHLDSARQSLVAGIPLGPANRDLGCLTLDPAAVDPGDQRVCHREQAVEGLRCREHPEALVQVRRLQPRLDDADPELHRRVRDPCEQSPVDAPDLNRELEGPHVPELPQLLEDPRLLGRERELLGGWKREAESLHQFSDALNRHPARRLDLSGAHRSRSRPSGRNDLRDPGLGTAELDCPRDRGL